MVLSSQLKPFARRRVCFVSLVVNNNDVESEMRFLFHASSSTDRRTQGKERIVRTTVKETPLD